MNFKQIGQAAKEKAGMPDNWHAYAFKCLPEYSRAHEMVEIIGICAPLKSKGKHKGLPNYKAGDKSTLRTVYLTNAELDAWTLAWEQRTDLCIQCEGTGQEWAGWSAKDGTRYRPCRKCNATGKSKKEEVKV